MWIWIGGLIVFIGGADRRLARAEHRSGPRGRARPPAAAARLAPERG